MNDIEVLNTLAEFLKNTVANKIKLEKPSKDNLVEGDYELVNPAVYIGWIPPKNFLNEYGYDVPSLVVMMDKGIDTDENAGLGIRIKIVTYDPGKTNEECILEPNTDGYKDLLNLITRIRLELSQNPIIMGKVIVNKPIRWDMDEEQNYPYWSANISFDVNIEQLKFNYEKYL